MITNSYQVLQEFVERQQHVINVYEPSKLEGHNQKLYHESQANYRMLLGGNQSGKSHAAAYDCAVNARGKNPYNINIVGRDVVIWVISTEYATIKTGIYRHLKNIIPIWDMIHEGPKVPGHPMPTYLKVRRQDGYETIITFMSSKGGEDARAKFQAAAVDYFYIDEEITGDIWEELEARTLATGGKFSISATLVESFEWILVLERLAERGDPNVFLTRLNTELNPYLDDARVALLKSKWSQETLEYRFYGLSRKLTGLIYTHFNRQKHVIKPFKIPHDWPRWCAIDPGIRTCAVLWIAVGPDNRAYAYRHIYAHNEPLWNVALEIRKIEGWSHNKDLSFKFGHYVWEETEDSEYMIVRLIDPKSRARSEAGEDSILNQLYDRYGLSCVEADNAVRPGIEDCRYWLEDLPDGKPGFQIFDTLEDFVDEIKAYRPRPKSKRRDASDPIEEPIRKKNHLMDCWRYIKRENPQWNDRKRMVNYNKTRDFTRKEEFEHETLGTEW